MKSFAIILFALATGAAAHPFHLNGLFSRQEATCTANSDCPATQFCAGSTCETFTDCRGTEGSCPGGTCSPSDGLAEGDPQNPTRQYQCNFPEAEPSPSAPASEAPSASASAPAESSAAASSSAEPSASASASESASVSVSASSAPSASASASPAPGGECAVNADCAATQYCDLSGEAAVCAALLDCRGEVDSCPGGFCIPENATFAGDAQDPSQAFICSFEPAPSASVSASSSASVSASASLSSASSAVVSGSSSAGSSASASATAAPVPSAEPSPSATAAPTQAPAPEPSHPAPEPTPEHPAPEPKPEPEHPKEESKPSPKPEHPKEESKPEHPKEESKDDSAWRDEYKDNKNGKNYCDQSKIESLLWEIKGELKGLKWEVEQLKAAKK